MKIREIIEVGQKLKNAELLKIGEILEEDHNISAIAEWMKYDLSNARHIKQFIYNCQEVENYNDDNELKPEQSFIDKAYENGQIWSIKGFYTSSSFYADLIDDFFCDNRELILQALNDKNYIFKGNFNIDDIIYCSEKFYILHYCSEVLEIEF